MTKQPPLQPYTGRDTLNNALDPDEQYLKSIKLDVPTFDGHLDPNFFRLASKHGYVFDLISPF